MGLLPPQIYGGYEQEKDEILGLNGSGLSAPRVSRWHAQWDDWKQVKRIVHCPFIVNVSKLRASNSQSDTQTLALKREELLPFLGLKGQGRGVGGELFLKLTMAHSPAS